MPPLALTEPEIGRSLSRLRYSEPLTDPRAAARKIRREYKRRLYVFHRGYRSRFIWYLSRPGIETLAVLYGQQPRAMVMASLRGP